MGVATAVEPSRVIAEPFARHEKALAEFNGVGRRFQVYGEIAAESGGRFTLVDDYGHHPAEMAATLAAALPAVVPRAAALRATGPRARVPEATGRPAATRRTGPGPAATGPATEQSPAAQTRSPGCRVPGRRVAVPHPVRVSRPPRSPGARYPGTRRSRSSLARPPVARRPGTPSVAIRPGTPSVAAHPGSPSAAAHRGRLAAAIRRGSPSVAARRGSPPAPIRPGTRSVTTSRPPDLAAILALRPGRPSLRRCSKAPSSRSPLVHGPDRQRSRQASQQGDKSGEGNLGGVRHMC